MFDNIKQKEIFLSNINKNINIIFLCYIDSKNKNNLRSSNQ
jgi:hypothetical protein